jgi:hypothetical protein
MRQIHAPKRQLGSRIGRQVPLPIEARDPDIVRAHRIARRVSRSRAHHKQRGARPKAE